MEERSLICKAGGGGSKETGGRVGAGRFEAGISESGLEMVAVSGVGVTAVSVFSIAGGGCQMDGELETVVHVQATERLDGSVYFVLLGSGEAGRLGVSWSGAGVDSAMFFVVLRLEGGESGGDQGLSGDASKTRRVEL